LQDKWIALKRKHEEAAEKARQEHQEKVREVTGRYADEIAKTKKLEEEVNSLSAKLEDLKKLEQSKRKKLEEEVKSLSAKVEELDEVVCVGGDEEEEEVGSVEQRIHACPCQRVASVRIAQVTKQLKDLNKEWGKDKRRVGVLQYLKDRKLKDGQYHRGYVFKEERVATRVVEEEVEERRQEGGGVGPITAEEQEVRVNQHVQPPPKDMSTRAVQRSCGELALYGGWGPCQFGEDL
jgi:DNA repair exonuclease SbcCD ATPase subunit